MNNESQVIHAFDFNLIGDFFQSLDRQGPCSPEITQQALQFIGELPADARIADLGCGTGGQTLSLAGLTPGHITAIDLMPAFVESLRNKVKEKNLTDRIDVIEGSMGELPFEKESLDLIYVEGAIYHIGFKYGLQYLRQFLKPGGWIAASEASWFTDTPREEIREFWNLNYPEIDTIPVKVAQMNQAGYTCTAHFAFPESSWWNYFNPMRDEYSAFLERHGNSPEARGLIAMFEGEVALYDKYKEDYGYVFYIGRKR